MNIVLWIVQVLLALFFGMAGYAHAIAYSATAANPRIALVGQTPRPLVVFIGICELLGAVGVILPWLTGIRRELTPLAAAGLATIMALAIPFHLMRGERFAVAMLLPVGLLAAFVAWGRWRLLRA